MVDSPSLRLRSARLVPSDQPCDVVLRDGRVSLVEPDDRADADEVVDLDGRWVLPGLWDRHVHFDQWAMARRRLDVSEAGSAVETAGLVAERLRVDPPVSGAPLEGYGFRDGLWPDAPRRDVLDAVASDVPVVLAAWDLHSAWINSAAARRYGVDDHPTGLLREHEWYPLSERLRAERSDVIDASVADALHAAASRGVVGIVELERPWQLDTWVRRVAAGQDALRVSCGVYPDRLDAAIDRGLRTGDPVPGTDGLVTMGPLKVIFDGALNTRTAYCEEPYADLGDDAPGRGMLNVSPDELVSLMRKAWRHGIEPAIHAIGDAANTLVLDAFETVGARGSIEHAQLLSRTAIPRFAALGVVASVQPEHALDDRDVIERFWPAWADRAYAFGDLVAAGTSLVFGSDSPVAPLDPWLAITAAVHRARGGQAPWHPEQTVPLEVALAASIRGHLPIRDGDTADLVVVDDDPMTASAERLRTMPVAGTLLAGRWTWRSGI